MRTNRLYRSKTPRDSATIPTSLSHVAPPWPRMRLSVASHGQYDTVPSVDDDSPDVVLKLFNTSTPKDEQGDGDGGNQGGCQENEAVDKATVISAAGEGNVNQSNNDKTEVQMKKSETFPTMDRLNIPTNTLKPNGNLHSPSGSEDDHYLEFTPNTLASSNGRIKGIYQDAMDHNTCETNTVSSLETKVFDNVAKRGRLFAKRQQRRLVFKDGECNISKNQITARKRRYFRDIFTTLLDMKWRYNLLLFGCAFVSSWLIFALLWFTICVAHGDHLVQDDGDEEPSRCVANVYSFPTALLFSIETQHTIGYGYRMIEPKCPDAFLLLMVQSCVGVFIQSLLTGLIFAKISRPKPRSKTMMFTKNAVICQRDGELYLLFRVGDMRKAHIIQTTLRAVMVKSRFTKEGELIPLCQYPLELETETSPRASENFILLSWPITVVHKINDQSPLWDISAEQLLQEQFELVVILEGCIESTGMMAQMRTSYLPGEILWGHRFAPLFAFWKDKGQYQVDFTQFDATIPIETPECSAKELAEKQVRESTGHQGLLLSNFLTIPAVHYSKLDSTHSTHSSAGLSNSSIFKRMRSSLKRRRSERRRNGSLPSISFVHGYDPSSPKSNEEEREIEINVSVESSIDQTEVTSDTTDI